MRREGARRSSLFSETLATSGSIELAVVNICAAALAAGTRAADIEDVTLCQPGRCWVPGQRGIAVAVVIALTSRVV